MKIDALNGSIINSKEICIHDDILNHLLFDRSKRSIRLHISTFRNTERNYTIDFVNVVGLEMTSCDFWAASPHIFQFEYISPPNQTLLPKLYRMKQKIPIDGLGNLSHGTIFIETVITLSSGDYLRIACESIVLNN